MRVIFCFRAARDLLTAAAAPRRALVVKKEAAEQMGLQTKVCLFKVCPETLQPAVLQNIPLQVNGIIKEKKKEEETFDKHLGDLSFFICSLLLR